jgi:nucleoside 2-deoxyribosyltransferase-like protein
MTNVVLVAPTRAPNSGLAIFLAGGITNSPRWQDEAIAYFERTIDGVTICNPRRTQDFEDDEDEYETQVTWELDHLLAADLALFWFPTAECRITRIELGLVAGSGKQLVVGADPRFVNRRYLGLLARRLQLPIYDSLDELFDAARGWLAARLRHPGE